MTGLVADLGGLWMSAVHAGEAVGMRRPRVDFGKLRVCMADHKVDRPEFALAFLSQPEARDTQDRIAATASQSGWEAVFYDRGPHVRTAHGRAVVSITCELLRRVYERGETDPPLRELRLCTGDAALCPMVEALKKRGVRVVVYAFPGTLGRTLQELADDVQWLDTRVLREEG
jgi:hypothetical protein